MHREETERVWTKEDLEGWRRYAYRTRERRAEHHAAAKLSQSPHESGVPLEDISDNRPLYACPPGRIKRKFKKADYSVKYVLLILLVPD